MDELLSAGYAFQVETTRFAHLAGSRIEGGPVRLLRARRRHIQDLPRRDPRHVRRAPPPPPPMRDRTPRRHVASLLHAPVAQWIERRPPEAEVRGSNPLGRVARPTPSDLQLGDQHGAKSVRSEDRRSGATRHRVRARASRSHEGARSATRAHGKGNVRRCGLLDTSCGLRRGFCGRCGIRPRAAGTEPIQQRERSVRRGCERLFGDMTPLKPELTYPAIDPDELVLGLAYGAGAEADSFERTLREALRGYGYELRPIRLSDYLPTLLRQDDFTRDTPDGTRRLQDMGDDLRKITGAKDALGQLGVYLIATERRRVSTEGRRVVWLVRSLKRPEEVATLRLLYGSRVRRLRVARA